MTSTYDPALVDKTISPQETMISQWYFEVGQDAIRNIDIALATIGNPPITRILDMPSGHGRVLRHLRARFPDAQIDACDLDESGANFCAATFGANPIISTPELTEAPLTGPYDLIFVGSLVTHVDHARFQRWMAYLVSLLSDKGLLLVTMHGRFSSVMQVRAPYISPEIWDGKIRPGYYATGYGYADYETEDAGLHGIIESDYGISIAKPSVMMKDVEAIPNAKIVYFAEACWTNHHDMIGLSKWEAEAGAIIATDMATAG